MAHAVNIGNPFPKVNHQLQLREWFSIFTGNHLPRSMTPRLIRHALTGYAFLLPGIAGFLLFTLGPIIASLVLSLFHWNLFGAPVFVDTANYGEMFLLPGSGFWTSAGNSLFFLLIVPCEMGIALFAASLLNENPKGSVIFKVLFFLPVVLSVVPVSIVWAYIFDTEHGLLNGVLGLAGIGRIAWLFDAGWIKPAIGLMSIWQGSAFFTIVYFAALQGIPDQLYEVATLDGAGRWAQFRDITLPLLGPTHVFLGITGAIGALQLFAPIQVMTHGNAGGARNLIVEVYVKGFQEFQIGYASAVSWILFIMIVLLTSVYWKHLRSRADYA
jgi:multiple sugar transport system permease protein